MSVVRWLSTLAVWFPSSLLAQSWNGPEVRALVARAIERRATVRADSGLRSFRARAHGFVFFLGQLGEGFSESPRLIKSDQLELEVYWRAPGLSKQIIIGRRDRRDLPTDIAYHRDHLGIVQNNFADSIRLGDGDEVRDVPHPLSRAGPDLYNYALTDSLTIRLPDRAVRVYQVRVRPRQFAGPRVAGALYLDVDQAEPVRFQFSFTPAAYRDATVEDITVVLDNALWFGRYWLPRQQEIEIRRRTSWLDLPARGIIRGRWEIGDYEFNPDLPATLFAPGTPEIVSRPAASRDSFVWDQPLDAEIRRVAGPVEAADLEAVRTTVERAVANRALTGLPRSRLSFGSLSEILHHNRVQGLAPGAGWRVRPGDGRLALTVGAAFGTADRRLTGRVVISRAAGAWTAALTAARDVVDVGDEPVVSPVLNSILSQERALDHGDYVLRHSATLALSRAIGMRGRIRIAFAVEEPRDVAQEARAAAGTYRPNPALGGPARATARVTLERQLPSFGGPLRAGGRVEGEGGTGAGGVYGRARVALDVAADLAGAAILFRADAGWGSPDLPVDRPFVLGGWGTLPGDPFRAWGGRHLALTRLEWRLPVPFPAVPVGAFGNTGARAVLAPFVAMGRAGAPMAGGWVPAPDTRVSAGVALELFHRLLRLEVGRMLEPGGRTGWSLDLRRDLWPVL